MKNVVIRKNKKWFNTLTGRYVKESTAKRYNSYFRRNPEGTLARAYGEYKYKKTYIDPKTGKKEKALVKHQKEWVRKLWKQQKQFIITKDVKGRKVYYSPFADDFRGRSLTQKETKTLKKLDYRKLGGKLEFHLHRMSKDGHRVYHIIKFRPFKEIRSELEFDSFLTYVINNVVPILKTELKKILKYHRFSKVNDIYGQFDVCLYSENDYIPTGKTFGRYAFNSEGIDLTIDEMIETFYYYFRKFDTYTYHYLIFNEISIYIRDDVTISNSQIAQFRFGVSSLKNGNI